MNSGGGWTAQAGGGLLNLVPQNGGFFKVVGIDSFVQALLQELKPIVQIPVLTKSFRDLADVASAFVHGFNQAFERFGENLVTLRAPKPPGFLEVSLGKSTACATQLRTSSRLLDFL